MEAATSSGGGFGPEGRKAGGRENHGACALRASLPEAVGAASPRREGVKELPGLWASCVSAKTSRLTPHPLLLLPVDGPRTHSHAVPAARKVESWTWFDALAPEALTSAEPDCGALLRGMGRNNGNALLGGRALKRSAVTRAVEQQELA